MLRFLFVLFACCFLTGCSKPKVPPAQGGTQARFDPFGSPPSLPTPTDLIRNLKTGLLQVPSDSKASSAQKEFNAYLNTLNGYPATAVPEVRFNGTIDASSVNASTVRVLDLTDGGVNEVKGFQYEVKDATENGAADSVLKIRPSSPWKRGHLYAVYILGGKQGVLDTAGKPIQRSDYFNLVAATEPLCVFEPTLSYNGVSGACNKPASGVPSGCCTRTVAASLVNLAKREVLASLAGSKLNLSVQEKEERKQMRRLGSTLEKLRQGYNRLLGASTFGGFSRENVVMVWHFSIAGMTELSFDPSVGVLPYPNNLLLDTKTKKIKIPPTQGESATQKALREGLNTLDGFTTQGSYYAPYTGSIDPSSIKLGESVWILNLATQKAETQWKVERNEAASAIVATPTRPLKEKTTYAIILVSKLKDGSPQAAGGLKDMQGRRVTASPFMALLRGKHNLVSGKTSRISTIDDATAQRTEAARLAHKSLFAATDKMKIKRADIVAAWTFTTQSITEPLSKLRALPWSALSTLDKNQPRWKGTWAKTFTRFPPNVPRDALGGWVAQGTFETWLALDESGRKTLLSDPSKGKPVSVPFMMTTPKGEPPSKGWPVVLYQHGLTRSQADFFAVANTLASVGFATVSFDIIYHGARTWCLQDDDCTDKGKKGSCNDKTGKCVRGVLSDKNKDGIPDASGVYFLNTSNPFAVRDNMRQHIIDASSFLRGIALGASLGLKDQSGKTGAVLLDPTQVHLVGHSLGAILGTMIMATDPLPKRAVLNVPGAPLVDIILTAPNFSSIRSRLLQEQGVKENSLDYLRLVTTFKWILDPADPANFAAFASAGGLKDLVAKKNIPKKDVMVMLAGQDQTIPIPLGRYLGGLLGASPEQLTSTTYPTQGHSFLLAPDPPGSLAATTTAQKQMASFLRTGKICRPNVDQQTCQ